MQGNVLLGTKKRQHEQLVHHPCSTLAPPPNPAPERASLRLCHRVHGWLCIRFQSGGKIHTQTSKWRNVV